MYLGLSDTLHKEYSPKGSPYAEYYQANGQVISRKMFGLHGQITPGQEKDLKTNGGLMYYQYNGQRSVTELTNRHGEEIEHYRYDVFGNIYTGITAPYNTVSYTGRRYDDKTGLVNMNARWYNSSAGRFITEDTYFGDLYNPQSLNRYAYVMNNPVTLWDPTGNIPSWVGDEHYYTIISGTNKVDDDYWLMDYDRDDSGWDLIRTEESLKQIKRFYERTVEKTWTYRHWDFKYDVTTDPITGEKNYTDAGTDTSYETYEKTDYYYDSVIETAEEIAGKSREYISQKTGTPPDNLDAPAFSVERVNGRIVNPDDIILGTGSGKTDKIITKVVQERLNEVLGTGLAVDGIYGPRTAKASKTAQSALGLPANGVLDVETFARIMEADEYLGNTASYSIYKPVANLYAANQTASARSVGSNMQMHDPEARLGGNNQGTGNGGAANNILKNAIELSQDYAKGYLQVLKGGPLITLDKLTKAIDQNNAANFNRAKDSWSDFLSGPSMDGLGSALYETLNYLTYGTGDTFNGAFMPDAPWSKEHLNDINNTINILAFIGMSKYASSINSTLKPSSYTAGNKGAGSAGKGFNTFNDAKKFLGSPGEGKQWHHIVEQSQINKSGFSSTQIQNTNNLIGVDKATHAKISGYYNSIDPRLSDSMRVRDWLAGQSFETQYQFGIDVLSRYGVMK